MNDPLWCPWVLKAPGQTLGNTETPFDFGQQQHTAIGRQPPSIKTSHHGLAANR